MAAYQLAEINIARFKRPIEDLVNADFVEALERVNAEAEKQPGFVWRLIGEGDDATDIDAFGDPRIIVNMSVWADMQALSAFAYRNSLHREVFRRKAEWFEEIEVSLAMWWVEQGYRPTAEEGRARLELLAERGPTPEAFTFKSAFPPPGA